MAELAAEGVVQLEQPRRSHLEVFLYFGVLTTLVYLILSDQYFVDVPTTFMLKHSGAGDSAVSTFRLVTALPVYLGFLFGLARDRWNLFGLRDRSLLLVFGPITAAAYFLMAGLRPAILSLYVGMLLAMVASRFLFAAYNGLLSLVGQEKLMPGRLSALWWIVNSTVSAIGAYFGGQLATWKPSYTFILLGLLTLALGLLGFWRPKSVFEGTYERPEARENHFVEDVKRLVRHRAIYPAVAICCLWNFAPGSNTALQFYLTNRLHTSDAVYGNYLALFAIGFVPTYLLYASL